jgi:hypothetical protein
MDFRTISDFFESKLFPYVKRYYTTIKVIRFEATIVIKSNAEIYTFFGYLNEKDNKSMILEYRGEIGKPETKIKSQPYYDLNSDASITDMISRITSIATPDTTPIHVQVYNKIHQWYKNIEFLKGASHVVIRYEDNQVIGMIITYYHENEIKLKAGRQEAFFQSIDSLIEHIKKIAPPDQEAAPSSHQIHPSCPFEENLPAWIVLNRLTDIIASLKE